MTITPPCNCGGGPCYPDCNANGILDECDIDPTDPDGDSLVSDNCDGNAIPDECELAGNDCNSNVVLDECDVDPTDPDGNGEVSSDCNGTDVPDECELAGNDCNSSLVPDECELYQNDCNANDVPDSCDVDPSDPDGNSEVSEDSNGDGIPDECVMWTESTGFEAAEGWNLGFMCDEATFTTCLGPPIPEVCTGDPTTDGNCCVDDPNPHTGWYTSISSQHCNEPHIDNAHPAGGDQHFRFQRDPVGGDPPGCNQNPSACKLSAFSPIIPDFPRAPTTVSVDVSSLSDPGGTIANLEVSTQCTWLEINTTKVRFTFSGEILVFDHLAGGLGYIDTGVAWNKDYTNLTIHLDPCAGHVTYHYGGKLIWEDVDGNQQFRTCIDQVMLTHDNWDSVWDIDNLSILRGDPCTMVCGDDYVDVYAGEECDGSDDTACPDRCIPVGDPNECTCTILPPAPQSPDPAPFGSHVDKNRYLSMVIATASVASDVATAIRVRLTSLHRPDAPEVVPDFGNWEGQFRWVNALNETHTCPDSPNFQGSTFRCAVLGCLPEYRAWGTELGGEVLHVTGAAVVPSSEYRTAQLADTCDGTEATCAAVSEELSIFTSQFGDVNPIDDGLIVLDVARIVDHMKGAPYPTTWPPAPGTGMFKPRVHLRPNVPDAAAENVGVLDVATGVDAVKGNAYWYFGDFGPCTDACLGEAACP